MIPSNEIATGRPLLAETDACSAMWVVRHESWQVTEGSEFPRSAISNASISMAYAFFERGKKRNGLGWTGASPQKRDRRRQYRQRRKIAGGGGASCWLGM